MSVNIPSAILRFSQRLRVDLFASVSDSFIKTNARFLCSFNGSKSLLAWAFPGIREKSNSSMYSVARVIEAKNFTRRTEENSGGSRRKAKSEADKSLRSFLGISLLPQRSSDFLCASALIFSLPFLEHTSGLIGGAA